MTRQRILLFPAGFLWGTASSSYQCEGGNTNNQWYRWEQQGHILTGEQCGEACNWWKRAERDFALAEQMGNNALRLSLEWSRIEPTEGRWDNEVSDRYRAMLTDLRNRNIKPIVTLHHFTEPLWFADLGGFAHEDNLRFFVRYVTHAIKSLQDLCDFWVTINEPNVYAVQAYVLGLYPPGEHNLVRAMRVLRNLMQAHVEAFYAISHVQPEAQIGYCLDYRLFDPANILSPLDRSGARLHETFFSWATLQAGETGRFTFPLNMLIAPIAHAAGARDYHGVNYYTREMVHFDPTMPSEMFGRRFTPDVILRRSHCHSEAQPKNLPCCPSDAVILRRSRRIWNDPGLANDYGEIYPLGLYRVLKSVYQRTRGNKPLYITENGFSDAIDDRRPRAILEHLAMVHRAISEGIPVRGYLHWSLVDNFEWTDGWGVRFGLIEVDPLTQERTARRSAGLFGEICHANAITEDIVECYAPEAMDAVFR